MNHTVFNEKIKTDLKKSRPIRSFVRREGRMTPAQSHAFEIAWAQYGIDNNQLLSISSNTVLEIGFGMGQSLLEQAIHNPDINYIGIEVHRPGIGCLLLNMQKNTVHNIRIFNKDAVDVLKNNIPDHSLGKIQIFFPDPWPKARHHKRRLIQPEFLALIHQKLKPDGLLHIATDWEDYAEYIQAIINKINLFQQVAYNTQDSHHTRPETKFEKRGKKLGHAIWDFVLFLRKP